MYDERLRESLPRVAERIAAAQARAGRGAPVTVVAVTKGHGVAAVLAALRAGLRDVGENRVQELVEKRGELAGSAQPVWHLIGHLQRNKVRRAITLFDRIHSIDSLRLAQELSAEAVRADLTVRGLVQVNVSGEATKGGFDRARALAQIAAVAALPALAVEGLMTMAPFAADEAVVRATFAATRALLERCAGEGIALQASELSMGMSGDYEIAIEEGSTMIRLGTILFGERVP
ncbi:MAG TPA: YggS family pyridoxal phosphate-dependent enzyme [Longimicrobiales bacterium]|nr:YggS family pyridoxal phosphate-dependent enzyme [Longimicrobiales bacterium]